MALSPRELTSEATTIDDGSEGVEGGLNIFVIAKFVVEDSRSDLIIGRASRLHDVSGLGMHAALFVRFYRLHRCIAETADPRSPTRALNTKRSPHKDAYLLKNVACLRLSIEGSAFIG